MPSVSADLPTADSNPQQAEMGRIRYANCWEDADVLVAALRPQAGKRVLSIASAGDNVLALLAEGAEVVAADLNMAQIACLELRCAAFRHLDYERMLAFLGVRDAGERLSTYGLLESNLSATSRNFWSSRPQEITNGIIHAGKFENYFRTFRKSVLPLIHSSARVSRLLEAKDHAERVAFWNETWSNRRWRMLCRLFFSRYVMSRRGRTSESFRFVEGPVSARIMQRVEYGLTSLSTHDNPYLEYIATGKFGAALPRYLRPEHFDAIRDGLDRLTFFHGGIEQAGLQYAEDGFDAFNLSDIFEYVDEPTATAIYGDLLSVARPGARIAYWNMLVPRWPSQQFSGRVEALDELSAELFARDKAFFYCNFHVDEVRMPLEV